MQLTPTLLLILDGWGQAPAGPGNAVLQASTPVLDNLLEHPSRTLLACSGRDVGLPHGFMGNSEVGHLNIGAGRIVNQDITRIDLSIERGEFAGNQAVSASIDAALQNNSTLHLLALLSDGGVHSHIEHLKAFIAAASARGAKVAIHAITDGRDTGTTAGLGFLEQILPLCQGTVQLASIIGRYYAMDRDKRWDRVSLAWNALVHGTGKLAENPVQALKDAYANGETDEFIKPILFSGPGHIPCLISDNDSLFFLNFRADRARQLSHCFADEDFAGFERGKKPRLSYFGTMTRYESNLPMPVAFGPQEIKMTIGEVIARLGMAQFRIAETEKYAHVTYFFNGGQEEPFAGEERFLVESPRDVATYDLKPEMSARQVTAKLVESLDSRKYPFIVCNLANLDMVGHTGSIPAVITACEVIDSCVGEILAGVKRNGGRIFVTADHGNAEEMLTADGQKQTAHSKNKVALIMLDAGAPRKLRPGGRLGDIAPTILGAFGLEQPVDMTGQNLLED